jgi:hypothetical protein
VALKVGWAPPQVIAYVVAWACSPGRDKVPVAGQCRA